MRVHVCIPHFAREEADPAANPQGYGSLRAGSQFQRALALNRCLHSLLGLQRQAELTVLNIHHKRIDHLPANQTPLELQISVCTDGKHQLDQVLICSAADRGGSAAAGHPRELPRMPRSSDRQPGADLLMYLEDDLVIHDPAFFDKQLWFLEKTRHRFSCPTVMNRCIKRASIARRWPPCSPVHWPLHGAATNAAQGLYGGQNPCTSISPIIPIPDVSL